MGGPLNSEEFEKLKKYPNIQNFVETGTYHADTTLAASKYYLHVYTTEIVENLYHFSKQRAFQEGVSNITFLLGDSVELLHNILPKVEDGAVFFIDAHQSGYDTGNNGKQQVPLHQELDVILSYPLGQSVFIFDDLRFFVGKEQEDKEWQAISTKNVLDKFLEHNKVILQSFEENDRFWVITQ